MPTFKSFFETPKMNSPWCVLVLLATAWLLPASEAPTTPGTLPAGMTPMQIPALSKDGPGPGRRFVAKAPEYTKTEVHHQVMLPVDWTADWKKKKRSWPVIVEYTGNYYPPSGSTGTVEDAALGYGLGDGHCLWIVLPFVAADHKKNELMWWGDEAATVLYAKQNVPRICEEYGGDPAKVVLCGFSRGAIAVNYIGLYDDDIAKLWCGLMSHDHYDGLRQWPGTTWGATLEPYQKAAEVRLQRLHGRPVLISQANETGGTPMIERYLGDRQRLAKFTYLGFTMKALFPQIPNSLFLDSHTDRWLLVDSKERRQARQWLAETIKGR